MKTTGRRWAESDLHGPVAYVILPVFAFANAGLQLGGLTIDSLTHTVTIGVILGLTIGKPVGILLFAAIGVLLGIAKLPTRSIGGDCLGLHSPAALASRSACHCRPGL